MKLSEVWQQYQDYTQDVTGTARKLALVVGGVCWALRDPGAKFPKRLLAALGLVVAFFVLDMLQGIVAAMMLRIWARREEKRLWRSEQRVEGEVDKPVWLDYPAFGLWTLKLAALLAAVVYLVWQFLVLLD